MVVKARKVPWQIRGRVVKAKKVPRRSATEERRRGPRPKKCLGRSQAARSRPRKCLDGPRLRSGGGVRGQKSASTVRARGAMVVSEARKVPWQIRGHVVKAKKVPRRSAPEGRRCWPMPRKYLHGQRSASSVHTGVPAQSIPTHRHGRRIGNSRNPHASSSPTNPGRTGRSAYR